MLCSIFIPLRRLIDLHEHCEEACLSTGGDEERVIEAEPDHVAVHQTTEMQHFG